jgi:hypothetical protein
LPGWKPIANTYGYSNRDCYDYTDVANTYGYSDSNDNTTAISYANSDTNGDPASANAKATAHAVSSADAVALAGRIVSSSRGRETPAACFLDRCVRCLRRGKG